MEPGKEESTSSASGSLAADQSDMWAVLPDQLNTVPVATEFSNERHRWNTNEEVASLLIAFDKHENWIEDKVVIRPPSGTMLFYNKNNKPTQRYRKDGYFWKKRRDGKTTREDHMKLKVQGVECIYGCYVHSAILPTFHRRSYWLLQNPDMVLVHYLNVPLTDETPLPPLMIQPHKQQWSESQLLAQLRPMFARSDDSDPDNRSVMSDDTIRSVAARLLEGQRRVECTCSNVCKCNSCRTCKQKRMPPQLVTYLSQRVPMLHGGGEQSNGVLVTPHGAAYHAADPDSLQRAAAMTPTPHRHITPHQTATKPSAQTRSVLINAGGGGGDGKSVGNKPLILNLSQLHGNNSLIILSHSVSQAAGHSPMTIISHKPGSAQQQPQIQGSPSPIQPHSLPMYNHDTIRAAANTALPHHTPHQTPHHTHHSQLAQNHQHTATVTHGQHSQQVGTRNFTFSNNMNFSGQAPSSNNPLPAHTPLQQHNTVLVSQGQTSVIHPRSNSQGRIINNQVFSGQNTAAMVTQQQYHQQNGGADHNVQYTANESSSSSSFGVDINCFLQQHTADKPQGASANQTINQNSVAMTSHIEDHNLLNNLVFSSPSSSATGKPVLNTRHSNNINNAQEPRRRSEGDSKSKSKGNRPQRAFTISDPAELSFIADFLPDSPDTGIFSIENTIDSNPATPATSAQAQMVESDMAVDYLIRELNKKNSNDPNLATTASSPFGDICDSGSMTDSNSVVTNDNNMPMQISPTSPDRDINLDDFVDLSFLDDSGLVSPPNVGTAISSSTDVMAVSNSLPLVTTTSSSSPISSIGEPQYVVEGGPCKLMNGGDITDFCPEWSYTKGGEKVLVLGPWYQDTSTYAVLFDGVAVPATLIQSGVLRCYCPDHLPGEATLEVACDGRVISNTVRFQYKMKHEENMEDSDWFAIEEGQLRTWLLQRLQAIESCLDPEGGIGLSTTILTKPQREIVENTEFRLIECVQQLSQKQWPSPSDSQTTIWPPIDASTDAPQLTTHTLSLLHLAAALGYARLISTLLGWRKMRPNAVLECEVDVWSRDMNDCTPLTWACAGGHHDAAYQLYKHSPEVTCVKNRDGHTPVDIARMRSHSSIANKLWNLEKVRSGVKTTTLLNHAAYSSGISADSNGCNSDEYTPQNAASSMSEIGYNLLNGFLATDQTEAVFKIPASPLTRISNNSSSNNTFMSSPALHNPSAKPVTVAVTMKDPCPNFKGGVLQRNGVSTVTGSGSGSNGVPSQRNNAPSTLSIDIPQDNLLQVKSPASSTPAPKSPSSSTPAPKSRRAHESRRSRLLKRISVEVLPDYPNSEPGKSSKVDPHASAAADPHQMRAKSLTLEETGGDPRLCSPWEPAEASHQRTSSWGELDMAQVYNDPMFSMNGRDLNSPIMFLPMEAQPTGLTLQDIQQHTAMETESSSNTSCSSSQGDAGIDDVLDSVSQQDVSSESNQGNQMATLANQIIAAIPERIKASPSRSDELVPEETSLRGRDRSSSYSSFSSCSSSAEPPPCAEDSGISTPLDPPLEGIAFDDYRYVDLGTPASSHSPASSLHSPYVDHFSMDSPPPTTAEFNEYFNAPQTYMEKDFSQLTLSDTEQRKLYEAAKIIQNFFRRFKDRREQQMLQRQRELQAAVLIQSYYRRYKQYLYYKKMTQAAVLIQSQFRSYYAQKRFRQSREAATLIQCRYRAYKEQERYRKRKDAAVLIQQRFRNHYQRKHQKHKSGQLSDITENCSKEQQQEENTSSSAPRSEHNPAAKKQDKSSKHNAKPM